MKLPLEYNLLAQYYDVLTVSPNPLKTPVIKKLLRQNKVRTVLDLTCGTGCQAFWLAKQGYEVTGADISPRLLQIAKQNARKEKLHIKWRLGDMRDFKVGAFDVVITIFNAVGHLSKTDFAKALRNIHRNLKKDGLYIFDIFNLQSINKKLLASFAMEVKKVVDGFKIHHKQIPDFDKNKSRLIAYDIFTLQKGAGQPKVLRNKFSLQLYTAKELQALLMKNGFEVIGQYDLDGSKFSTRKTKEILTVARKV